MMSDELNKKDKRDLLLATLASVREKLDKVKVKYDSLQKVQGAYRSIFNKGDNIRYDGLDERLDEELAKKQLELDILTDNCGIETLGSFLDRMGGCWLDFFGSDSFSDSKKKQQVFFATLCKDKEASKYRRKHVEKYQEFLDEGVPVDILIQVFFATIEELNGFKKLSKISKDGFAIKFKSGEKQKPNYKKEIEKVKDLYTKDPLKAKEKLFWSLEKGLSSNVSKDSGLLCLDYKKQFESCTSLTVEAQFLKGVCDINWSLHEMVKYVYFLPIPCPDGSNGLVCFGTQRRLGSKDRNLLNALSFDILFPFVSSYKTVWQHREVQKECIKSAVVALMARNLSHNLGSHYLTNTRNYFRKRIDIVTSNKKPTKDSLGADYRGNIYLLQYIKERMDFIATVVSGDPYSYGSLNFKAQLFDVLTEDDHGARHDKTTQNFLLKYLVFSEKLTRNDKNDKPEGYSEIKLRVIYEANGSEPVIYTGTVDNEITEEKVKLDLSQLELAVPGGLMGRHAFFCIIENIIRNSAKHSKKEEDLVISIKLKLNNEGKLDISIYDNRQGGEDVQRVIEKHFSELVILNEKKNNSVDKNSKGLKEMLICALWLKNENVAEKLYEIQSQKDGEKKMELIKKYLDVSLKGKNLCYTIKDVPLFKPCHQLKEGEDFQVEYVDDKQETKKNSHINLMANNIVNIHADIVAADMDYSIDEEGKRKLSDVFPRFIALDQFSDKEKEKWEKAYKEKNSQELFELYDNKQGDAKLLIKDNPTTIVIDSEKYSGENIIDDCIRVKKGNIADRDWTIIFKTHLDSKTSNEEKWNIVKDGSGKYLESESGENYTSTIASFDFLQDPVNRYKVVEAANTHIAIIDERIYGDFQTRWKDNIELEQKLLEMRRIYLLNFDKENHKIIDLQGKEFAKNEKINFVSIHLGLLDKKNDKESQINIKTDILDKYFGNKTFFSIHSGRGNFSADLEDKLKDYPFISLSALEAAFYDCKYFLTQLFKTTNYYGKGNITDK